MRVRLTVMPGAGYSMGPRQGRWTGKPVRNRRGPATVTGDADRIRSHWHRDASREGADGRPGSQETSLRPQADTPSRKGVAHVMKIRTGAGLAAGLLAAALLPPAAVAADQVTVNLRIEGPTKTLFEGPVSTGVRDFRFTGESTGHTCDGT